jgi:hypothetical protein
MRRLRSLVLWHGKRIVDQQTSLVTSSEPTVDYPCRIVYCQVVITTHSSRVGACGCLTKHGRLGYRALLHDAIDRSQSTRKLSDITFAHRVPFDRPSLFIVYITTAITLADLDIHHPPRLSELAH